VPLTGNYSRDEDRIVSSIETLEGRFDVDSYFTLYWSFNAAYRKRNGVPDDIRARIGQVLMKYKEEFFSEPW